MLAKNVLFLIVIITKMINYNFVFCIFPLFRFADKNLTEDGRLDFRGLAVKYGLKCEDFNVITDDGYILQLFHIPLDEKSDKLPVILMHGFADTADAFMIRGNISMVRNLSLSGYDVWVGNFRGNRYARSHVYLNPDSDKEFWDFSITEYGYYDYAAIIDYVLKKTGHEKLDAIGHSQATASLFALGSTRPEYNNKINVHIALGPVSYLQYVKGLAIPFIEIIWPIVDPLLEITNTVELLNFNSTVRELAQVICTANIEIGYDICARSVIFPFAGPDLEQFEQEFLPVLLGHHLNGVSRKSMRHVIQIMHSKRFAKYDYGSIKNLFKYGLVNPPKYDLSNVKMQTVLMVGKNDYLATVEDAKRLNDTLSNVEYFEMPRELFNHMDFLWAENLTEITHPYIHRFLNKYS